MYRRLTVPLAVAWSLSSIALAQTNEETFQQFEFNFATPGARANAMGRAFIGLADDATAAETNPAGLTVLEEPEASFEYKSTRYDTKRFPTSSSVALGAPVGFGERVTRPSFGSLVFTGNDQETVTRGRWRLALYYHNFLQYAEDFSLQARDVGAGRETLPVNGRLDFTGHNVGLAFAWKPREKLSVGASVKGSFLEVESRLVRKSLASSYTESFTSIDDRDARLGLAAGALWEVNERVNIGAVYNWNPTFELDENLAFADPVTAQPVSAPGFPHRVKFAVPDRFGLGVSRTFGKERALTLLGDVVWLRYSELAGGNTTIVRDAFLENSFAVNPYVRPQDFQIDDGVEVHLGSEWNHKWSQLTLSLRGGGFYQPEHRISYRGVPTALEGLTAAEQQLAAQFEVTNQRFWNLDVGDSRVGGSAGFGLAFKNREQTTRFQVDFAYVYSEPFDELLLSSVIYF